LLSKIAQSHFDAPHIAQIHERFVVVERMQRDNLCRPSHVRTPKSPDGGRPWPPLLSFYALTDSTHIRQDILTQSLCYLTQSREPANPSARWHSRRVFTGSYLAQLLARLAVTRRLVRHLAKPHNSG